MLAYILLIAATGNPTATAPAQAAEEPAKKERIICKADKFVGSHLTQRICKTETEWRIGKENAKDTLDARGRAGDYRNPMGPNN